MEHTSESIYSKKLLAIYNIWVLGFANHFAWKCPTKFQLDLYNQHVSEKHLDIGAGTGYFLDKCNFPTKNPEIHLLDLNRNCLELATKRIQRYQPIQHQADVLKPLKTNLPSFDSIAINCLLHCLPGNMADKEQVFKNLIPHLKKDGVLFGSTVLGSGIKLNMLGKKLMHLLNKKGIFNNTADNLPILELILNKNFTHYQVKTIGCVALFSASGQRL